MNLEIDPDVKMVAEFMQERIAASRLTGTAEGLAALAPLLWGRYDPEEIRILQLSAAPILLESEPAASSECALH